MTKKEDIDVKYKHVMYFVKSFNKVRGKHGAKYWKLH